MATQNSKKKDNKNTKALFSVVCLCIIALGLIVYFSTNTSKSNTVNEATTLAQTTQVQKSVTTAQNATTTTNAKTTTAKSQTTTTKKDTSTSMESGDSNTPYKSFYKYPISEAVLKGYSEELVYSETLGDYRAHPAVDFIGEEGVSVVAINDGLVTDVYKDSLYGTVVEIDHGGSLVAKYCGLDSATVKKGDYVTIGNTIGTLGSVPAESKDGTHLHFETTMDKTPVNPLDVMSKTE